MSILETNKIRQYSGNAIQIVPTGGGNVQIGSNLIVSGTVRAEEFITTIISSSIVKQSGSSVFGNSSDDTHQFIGGVYITGTTFQTGNVKLTGTEDITGSLKVSSTTTLSNTNLTGNLTTVGTNTHTGNAFVVGNTEFTGSVRQAGNLNINGQVDLTSDVTINGTLTTTSGSNTTLQGTLEIPGITNVSGSISILDTRITNTSASLAAGIATNLGNINSNDADISALQIASGSYSTRVTTAEGHIENLHAFTGSLNDTYATDAELAAVSGALVISIDTSVAGLNAASSSYALTSDLLVATASIAANETSIGALNAATSSFAFTTGSIFTGKQELTGSIDVSGSISIKPTGYGLTNRLSFDTSEFHAKSPGFYWMTDSITIGSNDESTLFAQLNSTRLEVRTLLTLNPVSTKPSDLTAGTFAVSGSTPIYCDGADWYPINLGTALP